MDEALKVKKMCMSDQHGSIAHVSFARHSTTLLSCSQGKSAPTETNLLGSVPHA